MTEQQEKIPQHCPGTSSESAGKASACDGCPNKKICASAPKGPDPDVAIIAERLRSVKKKILVLSGKGGVGKSSLTSQLAFTLAQDEDLQIGVVDLDICGPSIPKIMGTEHESVHHSNAGWTPIYAADNIAMISIGHMLESEDQAVIWRGPKKNGMIKQFLRDVAWDDLDYLLVDTPPGTSDEHISIVQLLKDSGIDGAIVITTPQEVSMADVRREINFCKKVKVPILGVIENMSMFQCPKCHKTSEIFKATTGGGAALAADYGVPFYGSIPLDPRIARACDDGEAFVEEYPESLAAQAYMTIAKRVQEALPVERDETE